MFKPGCYEGNAMDLRPSHGLGQLVVPNGGRKGLSSLVQIVQLWRDSMIPPYSRRMLAKASGHNALQCAISS